MERLQARIQAITEFSFRQKNINASDDWVNRLGLEVKLEIIYTQDLSIDLYDDLNFSSNCSLCAWYFCIIYRHIPIVIISTTTISKSIINFWIPQECINEPNQGSHIFAHTTLPHSWIPYPERTCGHTRWIFHVGRVKKRRESNEVMRLKRQIEAARGQLIDEFNALLNHRVHLSRRGCSAHCRTYIAASHNALCYYL